MMAVRGLWRTLVATNKPTLAPPTRLSAGTSVGHKTQHNVPLKYELHVFNNSKFNVHTDG